jgi:hypothetical protein
MFTGGVAGDAVIGKAQVLGALAGVVAVVVAVVVWWPRRGARRAAAQPVTSGQADAAREYLATETLRYWRVQAKQRQITTPSPVSVRWAWAGEDVAIAAGELQYDRSGGLAREESPTQLLTAGVVTQLREQLYQRLDDTRGRIVVLGGPGAGKTAAMLLLLIDILEHRPRGADQPVPVWLTPGGWNPQVRSLPEWAAATLTRDYPGLAAPAHGGPGAALDLIRTGRVALFLDGLDEMAPAVQGQALQRIDREAAGLRVVLTSRPTEYRAALAEGRLYGAAVLDILPVAVQDAAAFLLAEQLGQRRRAWQQVTDHLRDHPDSIAARTLTTPLALSLARDTYAHADPADLLNAHAHAHPTPDALLQHLLIRSLVLAYPKSAEREHATHWLSWIAHHMDTNRDLRWWDIPTWTEPQHPRLTTGLGARLGAPLAVEPRAITPRWPTRKELPHVLAVGLRAGAGFRVVLRAGLMAGAIAGIAFGIGIGLLFGLTFGIAVGFAVGLMELWAVPLPTARAVNPVKVYWSDYRSTLTIGLGVGLTFGFGVGLTVGLRFGLRFGLVGGLVGGLVVGLLAWDMTGSGPARELTISQLTWLLRGRRIRFLPLLQTALHRQVLRQAGAVYQFRHAALQDILKTQWTTPGQAAPLVPDSPN